MLKLVGQRFAFAIATLVVVSGLIFAVTELLPRDLAANILGSQATPENVAAMRGELDLDRPAYQRYVDWIGGALRGDLGRSLANKRAVIDVIAPRLANSFFLAFYAAVIAVPLSLLFGILAAARRHGILDRGVQVVSLAAVSMPEFLVGYALILVLSAHLPLFPAIADIKPGHGFFQHLRASFLPMLTLILVAMAHMTRTTRAAMLEAMASPYVEMAVLKGLSPRRIVMHHALPNALASIVRGIAMGLGYLIVGILVVEAVFSFNGFGRLMIDAVAKRDIPMVQACGLVFAVVFIVLGLLADVLSILSSPRASR